MNTDNSSRRDLLKVAMVGTAAASLVVASTGSAVAYQGNMERALGSLQEALVDLHHASSDKGGHKGRAIALIQQAMNEVQAGINFAAQHFGD